MIKSNIKFSQKLQISSEEKEYICKCLPSTFDTDVKDVNIDNDFEVFIRINAKTIDDIQKWIAEYQSITKTSYSVETTYKCSGQRILFKRSFHCQHKTRHKHTYDPVYRKSIKNTNCQSIFSVSLRTIKKRYQGKDKSRAPDETKPCEIRLKLRHNHSTDNSMALKFKKVLPEVKQELIKLFSNGHTAATALQTLKLNMLFSAVNFDDVINDRSKCPDYSYCHYLYHKTSNRQNFDEFDDKYITGKIKSYNKEEEKCKIEFTDNGFVVCITPSIVKRTHQYQVHCSEVIFMDSFSISDKQNAQIYTFTCQNEVSILPVGIIITSNNDIQNLCKGLEILRDTLGNVAFFSNPDGPEIFFAEEFMLVNNILTQIWPRSKIFLTIYHCLQNIYKYINTAKNGIGPSDKQILFLDFYNLVYSSSTEDFDSKYEIAFKNSLKYKHYNKILTLYNERRQLWCPIFRPQLVLNSSYNEYYPRLIRTKIFEKLKSFNLIQTLDFCVNNFFQYFESHLINISLNKKHQNFFLSQNSDFSTIQVVDNDTRLVPSEKDDNLLYLVNCELLTCTCFTITNQNMCHHIKLIMQQIFLEKLSQVDEFRSKFYLIATGESLDSCQFDTISDREVKVEYSKKNYSSDSQNNLKFINDKFELLLNDAENLLPALEILFSRFEAVRNLEDICTVFGIEDIGKKSTKNKTSTIVSPAKKRKKEDNLNIVYLKNINMIE